MNPNSLSAYFDEIRPKIKRAQYRVLRQMRSPFGHTAEGIAAAIGVPVHTISGRITELKAAGLIEAIGRTTNAAGNRCDVLKLTRRKQPIPPRETKNQIINRLHRENQELKDKLKASGHHAHPERDQL